MTAEPTKKVGVYDSRALAYAWFWTPEHQQQLKELMKQAKAARDSGKAAEFKALDAKLKEHQKKLHEEVFSTAPAEEALAALKERLPEIQKEAGVSELISKWDTEALKGYGKSEQVDVTDRLVQEFKPGKIQLKVIKDMQTKPPVPLKKLRKIKDI